MHGEGGPGSLGETQPSLPTVVSYKLSWWLRPAPQVWEGVCWGPLA